ncbi:sterol desaturase family protein [Novosphingobium mangrovi (ex Huang et al. 2023)]|uniref:Sterol desaturase family protein n=1 Tax=Novosphingobium mangrovi (ex Huang et al. 2023) TaxID=2976432 RepID=A0ABT2I224_9SPHN|nr:sterol desaturase family protein [Novosphingobium mangrovi (ex Huang et al. 2023)]MCT2398861.1 sterol desaturase family protein [Novosphingobium mangrovi (ex Huang et al. 2023)]
MNSTLISALAENYHWQLSLITGLGIIAASMLGKLIAHVVPTLRDEAARNAEAFRRKMEKPSYSGNQKWNRKWSVLFIVVIFGGILPFCLTAEAQPWWRVLRDVVVILMVYDFFYYLTHRFLFHDSALFGGAGPLKWMHAIHHRQHNPCRWDASYIHPLEIAIGLGLYVATIFGLAQVMGTFHVVTVVVTWVAFNQINLHNHDLWETDRFPFRYLNYASVMHHNHHARFTGGNFATITLLYDWMFGTLDKGEGYRGEFTPQMAAQMAAAKAGAKAGAGKA